jgi:mRNA-degrading endonuclease RelE of RelBE toxin-antitoxin system
VFQVIFNEISAAEISQLPTLAQLEVLNEFQVSPGDLENLAEGEDSMFGTIEREGKTLYRYRANDFRIYFEVTDNHEAVVVHRVLNRNTFADFLFRANLSKEDDDLSKSKHFWKLIEEGENARRV